MTKVMEKIVQKNLKFNPKKMLQNVPATKKAFPTKSSVASKSHEADPFFQLCVTMPCPPQRTLSQTKNHGATGISEVIQIILTLGGKNPQEKIFFHCQQRKCSWNYTRQLVKIISVTLIRKRLRNWHRH